MLDHPQFTPPSSASPKQQSHSGRFPLGTREQAKLTRQASDYSQSSSTLQAHPSSNSVKSASRPTSPYVEPERTRARGYSALSPQREHHAVNSSNNGTLRTTASSSSDNVLASRYAAAPRSAGMSSVDTPSTARFAAHNRGLSIDGPSTNSILPTDKPFIRVIFDTGRSCVFKIDGCSSVEEIMLKTLRKGNLNEAHIKSYCFYVLDNTEPNPALCRRINDAEIMRICSDRSRPERNRLILRKIHLGEPDDEQLKTAASIAAQMLASANGHGNIQVPASIRSQNKIKQITGEALPPVVYPQSPAASVSSQRHIFNAAQQDAHQYHAPLGPRPRMKEVFGGRPPSELIASDLPTYFPNFAQDEIDRTVRMSIRRSRRVSRATNRLSMASNISSASSYALGKDAPPIPALHINQLQGLPSIQDQFIKDQPRNMRPLSVLRLGGGLRDSIASSVLERLDEESAMDDTIRQSFASYAASEISVSEPEGHTVMQSYYDDGRSSLAASSISEGVVGHMAESSTLNKRLSQAVQEDSEESDEELNEYLETDSWDNVKYMQGALIGQGSFGSVYIALHAVTGELMAVKQVEMPDRVPVGDSGDAAATAALDAKKNTMVEALKHEIGLLRELKHPNIVQYLGSNTEETRLNIFLEYVPGGSVASMLVNYGPLGESLICHFVRQILEGLTYLHSMNIIHRDIKGANILVDQKGGVKISDFGISKRVNASSLLNENTTQGKKAANRVSLQGSVFWMAPEVVKQTAYTRKADIWSLGCVIVEMLTGQHPHPNCSQLQAIFKIGRGVGEQARPTVPENASEPLQKFLAQTFELEHEQRPEAEELLKSEWLTAGPDGK
jgi:mitogen-activated protein kinase kinase kinase